VGARSHRALEAVGRLGGDEFVALLPEVADEARRRARGAAHPRGLREPIFVGGQECFVTASVGVAMYPRDGVGGRPDAQLRRGDVLGQGAGRNAAAIYSPQLAGRGREKLELESALHKAIERNELVLHYQPKIDVRSRAWSGAEALMRWQRGGAWCRRVTSSRWPRKPASSCRCRSGLLREAARQARQLAGRLRLRRFDRGQPAHRMFERSDLVEHIHHASRARRAAPVIQLEITETT
jgi:predicted signal transduction protein with EAL and GGDEF domain